MPLENIPKILLLAHVLFLCIFRDVTLWEQLQESLRTKLIRSSAYHPQIDGQTERINQILEDLLRA